MSPWQDQQVGGGGGGGTRTRPLIVCRITHGIFLLSLCMTPSRANVTL